MRIDFVDVTADTILRSAKLAQSLGKEAYKAMAIGEQTLSRNEILQRAQALLPGLKARAGETEALRQIPPATIEELKTSSLIRVGNPARYGGYGNEADLYFEVAMELGRACGSTAWCYSVWSSHNWMIGHWPEEAQDEYFAAGPDVLSSSAFATLGQLQPVDGGFRLAGRWDFSSGSDGATWAMLGAIGPGGPCMVLVPRSDYEIIDTWFVSGLRGTGSKDIQIKEAFVPAHRVTSILGPMTDSPGYDLHGRASYRLPTMSILPFTLCSPLVGMAQGALDEFIDRLKGKTGRGRTAESVAIQIRIAESSAEIDAARLLVNTTSRELIDRAARDDLPTEMDVATARRTYGYVAKLCLRAVNRLFDAGGGHSLYDSHALQRFHRDVHAGSHQVALYWDSIAEGYGRAALGLPPLNPFG